MTDYAKLCREVTALVDNVPYATANLANAAACLWENLTDINWAGFYLLQKDALILGPFQGKPACIRIPVGKGVCGSAVAQDSTLVVPDVHAFPGHIACDCASRSEIVIPLRQNGKILGVLDIDSPLRNRFSQTDREGLEAFVHILENSVIG